MPTFACALQQALRERFGIAPNQAHRALADCEILLSILPHLLKLNETPDLAQLMRQDSTCSGTLGDVLGPGELASICPSGHHST